MSRKNSNDRAACTVLAGAAGGVMARKIYDTLHEEDRPRMQQETNKVLVEDVPQTTPQTWTNPNTGLSASVVVKEQTRQQVVAPVRLLKGPIMTPPPLELIGEIYTVAVASTNIRGGQPTPPTPWACRCSRPARRWSKPCSILASSR